MLHMFKVDRKQTTGTKTIQTSCCMALQVLASLAQHELPSEHLALMHSTAARGQVQTILHWSCVSAMCRRNHAWILMTFCLLQRVTKRQKLKKALAFQRLGLEAPSESLLYVERQVGSGAHALASFPCLCIFPQLNMGLYEGLCMRRC